MNKIIFLIIGVFGFALWFLIGRNLVKRSETSSRQFAGFMAGYLGLLVFVMVFLADNDIVRSIILGFILFLINFVVAYPIAYYSFPLLRNWYQQ